MTPATLSVAEFAAFMGLPRRSVYAGIEKGEIRALRRGRSLRIPRSERDRLLGESPAEAGPAPPVPVEVTLRLLVTVEVPGAGIREHDVVIPLRA